jgi:cytochrome b561
MTDSRAGIAGKRTLANILSAAIFLAVIWQLYQSSKVGTTPRGTPAREALQHAHISTGLIALLLVIPRLWLWKRLPLSPAPAGIPAGPDALARRINLAFLLTVLFFGISGPLFAWSEGHAVSMFGLITIPSPFAAAYQPAVTFGYFHSVAGFWILYLAIFAVLVAIYQRLRYRVPLLRMLPVMGWGR